MTCFNSLLAKRDDSFIKNANYMKDRQQKFRSTLQCYNTQKKKKK